MSDAGPHVAAFFCAPERTESGLQLLIATLRDSRKLREIVADPRVAFMCYPGNASRWITGWGMAQPVGDDAGSLELSARLVAHAPGAKTFIDSSPFVPVQVQVVRVEIVDAVDTEPRVLEF